MLIQLFEHMGHCQTQLLGQRQLREHRRIAQAQHLTHLRIGRLHHTYRNQRDGIHQTPFLGQKPVQIGFIEFMCEGEIIFHTQASKRAQTLHLLRPQACYSLQQ